MEVPRKLLLIVELALAFTLPSLFRFKSMALQCIKELAERFPHDIWSFVKDVAKGRPGAKYAPLPLDGTGEGGLSVEDVAEVVAQLAPHNACLDAFVYKLSQAIFTRFTPPDVRHVDWDERAGQLKAVLAAIRGTAAFDSFATAAARTIFEDGVCWSALSSMPTSAIISAVDHVLKRALAARFFAKQIAWQLPHSEAVKVFSAALHMLTILLKGERNRVYNANVFFDMMEVVAPCVDDASFLEALVDLELPTADELRPAGNAVDEALRRWRKEQHRIGRLLCIDTMGHIWRGLAAGAEPDGPATVPPTRVGLLSRGLSLRRLCRVRGDGAEEMANELVEPFAREVVRFL